MDTLYFSTLFLFLSFLRQVNSTVIKSCEISLLTLRAVKECPKDEETWMEASRRMNCSSIRQSCVSPESFRYHCVINAWRNQTLEVCAPTRIILGFCTEFNRHGAVIQDHYSANCRKFNPPCPPVYNSDEAYKYQECYKLKKRTGYRTLDNLDSNGFCRMEVHVNAILLFPLLALLGRNT